MKTRLLLFPVLALTIFFAISHSPDAAANEGVGYSIEVKVTPKEREARVTKATGVALELTDRVRLPVTLAHTGVPATMELNFDLSSSSVFVEIFDLQIASNTKEGIFLAREFFEGDLYFELGKEKTICETADETISFTLTAPAQEKAENEAGAEAKAKNPAAIDVSLLEVTFNKASDRRTIYGTIYNPTERQISQLVVRVKAPASGEFEGLDRRYVDKVSVGPLSDSSVQIDTQLPALPEGVEYEFTLESAR